MSDTKWWKIDYETQPWKKRTSSLKTNNKTTRMSSCYTKNGTLKVDEVRDAFRYAVRQSKKDVCYGWNKAALDWCMFTAEEIKQQMTLWRKLAKEGHIAMNDYNNKVVTVEGVKYYTLVVQGYKKGRINPEDGFNCWCAGAMAHGTMVDGAQYYFKSEANRDAVYAYVMKGIEIKDR
jgi:hypothetical protein